MLTPCTELISINWTLLQDIVSFQCVTKGSNGLYINNNFDKSQMTWGSIGDGEFSIHSISLNYEIHLLNLVKFLGAF